MVDSNNSSAAMATARSAPARPTKSAAAFRTISEVAGDLDVAQHVLRFWESKFPQVRPLKRGGGRRYYRPEDVELLRTIRSLLYEEGYTIKGAQKLLKGGRRAPEGDAAGLSAGGEADATADPSAPQPTRGPAAPRAAPAPPPVARAASNSSHGKPAAARGAPVAPPVEMRSRLEHLRDELVSLRDMLRRAAE